MPQPTWCKGGMQCLGLLFSKANFIRGVNNIYDFSSCFDMVCAMYLVIHCVADNNALQWPLNT